MEQNCFLLLWHMERNKKLVFFSVFPPYRGGISKFSNLLAQNISKHVEVVPINFKKQYPKILFPGKTQYDQSIPYKKIDRIGSTFNPLSYGKLSKRIDQEDPDIFMASYWMTFMSPLLSKISRSRSKKCLRILIVHNFIPHESRFFDSYMNRKILNSFDRFIVLSNKVRDEILSMDSSKKVLVIPHPEYNDYLPKIRKEDAIKKIGLDKNKKTILFFGLIRPYKGLDLLIKAFSMLPNDYQLIIAGEVYGKKDKYEQLIDNSKNKNILFTNDFIPENEVHIYFSSADLCVLPYISGKMLSKK